MAADLHIHAMVPPVTEADVSAFFANPRRDEVWRVIADSPSIHVGEVSWLKAAVTGDDKYVPSAVEAIQDLIGERHPVIDDALIAKVRRAMELPNETSYSMSSTESVIAFLEAHKGAKAFTVSW